MDEGMSDDPEEIDDSERLFVALNDLKQAEAEILRLREGLRELRHGMTMDANVIDKLLKIKETTEF